MPVTAKSSELIISSLKWDKEPKGFFKINTGTEDIWGVRIKSASPSYETSGVNRSIVSFLSADLTPRGITSLVDKSLRNGFWISSK